MKVGYINPFIVATREVFKTMIKMPVMLGKPYLRDPGSPPHKLAVVIAMRGAVDGQVVIGLSEGIATTVATAMLGTPFDKVDGDCIDAIKEMANMIVGGAKKDLPGGIVEMALPRVVVAPQVVAYPPGWPIVALPCDAGAGRFTIEMTIREIAPAKAA